MAETSKPVEATAVAKAAQAPIPAGSSKPAEAAPQVAGASPLVKAATTSQSVETPASAQTTAQVPAKAPQATTDTQASVQKQAMGASFRRQVAEAQAPQRVAQVVQQRPKDPESAADIKAKTPPPPIADNRGVEQRLDAMTKQQTLGQQKAERDTESQNTPNIPFEFDDYTLQLWSHDRA